MRIAFRVDATAVMGTGHLMRCRTLADALKARGHEVRFVCRQIPAVLRAQFEREYDLVLQPFSEARNTGGGLVHSHWLEVEQTQDAHDTLRALAGRNWDWLVVDHYGIDARWESVVRKAASCVMVIDDLADRHHDCELLLDQNFVRGMNGRYANLVPRTCVQALGPDYALLHPDYATCRAEVAPRSAVTRILVFFGGGDSANLTERALLATLSLGREDIAVDVVLPLFSGVGVSALQRLASSRSNVTFHEALPTLAPLIARADLAMGAIGSTSWERLCLGLPTLAVVMAKNQEEVALALQDAGVIDCIGTTESVTAESIACHLKRILVDNRIAEWSKRCMQICDGRGTQRVVDNMIRILEDVRRTSIPASSESRLTSGART